MPTDLHHVGGSGEGTNAQARWQKHVIVALWVLLLVFIVLIAILFHGKSQGKFQPGSRHATPVTAWPDN